MLMENTNGTTSVEKKVENGEDGAAPTVQVEEVLPLEEDEGGAMGVEQQCSAGSFINNPPDIGNTQYFEEIIYRSPLYSELSGDLFDPGYVLEEWMSTYGAEFHSDEDIQKLQLISGITSNSFQTTDFQADNFFANTAAGDETKLPLPTQISASPLHISAVSVIPSQPTDFNNSFTATKDIDTMLLPPSELPVSPVKNTAFLGITATPSQPTDSQVDFFINATRNIDMPPFYPAEASLSPVHQTDVLGSTTTSVYQPPDLQANSPFNTSAAEDVENFIKGFLSSPPKVLLSPVHTTAIPDITTSSFQPTNPQIGCKHNSNLDQTMTQNKALGKKKKKEVLPEGVTRKCHHCSTENTPQWRAGPDGPKTLCNACGVRHKSGRLLQEYRPASSPTFTSSNYSNSHRKVLEIRRQKGLDDVPVQQLYPPLLLPPPPRLAPTTAMGAAAATEQNMYLYSAPVDSRFSSQNVRGYHNLHSC